MDYKCLKNNTYNCRDCCNLKYPMILYDTFFNKNIIKKSSKKYETDNKCIPPGLCEDKIIKDKWSIIYKKVLISIPKKIFINYEEDYDLQKIIIEDEYEIINF